MNTVNEWRLHSYKAAICRYCSRLAYARKSSDGSTHTVFCRSKGCPVKPSIVRSSFDSAVSAWNAGLAFVSPAPRQSRGRGTSDDVYRSSRTIEMLRVLREHGTRTWFDGWPTLPSGMAFRKLCEQGLITARRAFAQKSLGRDVVVLEVTITDEGRKWIDVVDAQRRGAA